MFPGFCKEGTIREIWGLPTNSEGTVNWRWPEPGELGINGDAGIVSDFLTSAGIG